MFLCFCAQASVQRHPIFKSRLSDIFTACQVAEHWKSKDSFTSADKGIFAKAGITVQVCFDFFWCIYKS